MILVPSLCDREDNNNPLFTQNFQKVNTMTLTQI